MFILFNGKTLDKISLNSILINKKSTTATIKCLSMHILNIKSTQQQNVSLPNSFFL